MTDRDILIELLAIKTFEHSLLANGQRHTMSWHDQDPVDRENVREVIRNAPDGESCFPQEEP